MLSDSNELTYFSKKNIFPKSFITKSWILFAYMMKHSTITAQGVFFSLYVYNSDNLHHFF